MLSGLVIKVYLNDFQVNYFFKCIILAGHIDSKLVLMYH